MSTLEQWLHSEAGRKTLDLLSLWATLTADVAASRAALAHPTPFARRQYIRAAIAKVEGFTAMLKRLTASSSGANALTPAEQLLLVEQTPVLNDKAKPQLVKQYPRLEVNLRFAMRLYARVHGVDYDLSVGDSEWDHLCRTIKTRNRLMHPKTHIDLEVSDDELTSAATGLAWLDEKHRAMQELILEKVAYDAGLTADEVRRFRNLRRTFPLELSGPSTGGLSSPGHG